MELVFHYTRSFEKDLEKISSTNKKRISKTINQVVDIYSSDKRLFFQHIHRPTIILADDLKASLYVMRIGTSLRLVFTIDDDPLFDQIIITLLRIAKSPDEYSKIFSSIVESLYQRQLVEYGE